MPSARTKACVRMAIYASEDARFLAIVMGYQADIERLHSDVCSSVGINRIHMREMGKGKRSRVLEEISRLRNQFACTASR